jgi:uncharacterized protein (TIGR02145 family)
MKIKISVRIISLLAIFQTINIIGCDGANEKKTTTETSESYFNDNIDTSKIIIGSQVWMAKNLNISKFNNGDTIHYAKTNYEWQVASENKQPAWCFYDNDPRNGIRYGKLYNWYAVNDVRGLSPKGWHIPSDKEWDSLILFLDPFYNPFISSDYPTKRSEMAGNLLKSTSGWEGYTTGGDLMCTNCANWNKEYRSKVPCHNCKDTRKISTPLIFHSGNGQNTSGFSGLPCGKRLTNGQFLGIGIQGNWWSTSQTFINSFDSPNYYYLNYGNNLICSSTTHGGEGYSIRCVKD